MSRFEFDQPRYRAGSASMSDVGPYALARRSFSSRSVSDRRERVMRSIDSESEFDAEGDPSTIATYTWPAGPAL